MTFDRQELANLVDNLAVQGVYVGTSSWKYPGWFDMLYEGHWTEPHNDLAETARHPCDANDSPLVFRSA